MPDVFLIIFSLILVIACGVFVAAEFSFITVNRSSINRMAKKGDKRARGVNVALKSLSTQLSGAQVGITITNLCIGFLAEPVISSIIETPLKSVGVPDSTIPSLSVLIGLITATAVTMVFGELVPKNYALAKPVATAKLVQGPQRLFSSIMRYPIKLLNGSANSIIRRFGISPQEELASARSADELSSLVKRSAEHGTLAKETALILERTLVFDDLTALDVMTPRVRMLAVQADQNLNEVTELAKASGFSRFPVYSSSLDDIVGIIHIKQIFEYDKQSRSEIVVRSVMRKPIIIPSSVQLDTLLEKLRKGGMQMAIVIDEFGGTDGLVTMEDLVEELVGEVHDEYDHSNVPIRKTRNGGWIIDGLLRPDEVGEEIGLYLPETEVETVGGLISHQLERVASVGDTLHMNALDREGKTIPVLLRVIAIDKKRIDKVRIEIINEQGLNK